MYRVGKQKRPNQTLLIGASPIENEKEATYTKENSYLKRRPTTIEAIVEPTVSR